MFNYKDENSLRPVRFSKSSVSKMMRTSSGHWNEEFTSKIHDQMMADNIKFARSSSALGITSSTTSDTQLVVEEESADAETVKEEDTDAAAAEDNK